MTPEANKSANEVSTDEMRSRIKEYSRKVGENKPVLPPSEPTGKINKTLRGQ